MNLRDIANELRKQGHSVSYTARSDGSIIINFIDGQKFQAKEGNKTARSMLGEGLSEKQKNQRLDNLERAKKGRRSKAPKLSKSELKKLRRLNEKIKKTGSGRLGKTKARELKKQGGWKRVEEAAKDIMRKNLNIADDSLIDSLEARMSGYATAGSLYSGYRSINNEMDRALGELAKQHSWITYSNFESMISLIYALDTFVRTATAHKGMEYSIKFRLTDEYKMAVNSKGKQIYKILKGNKQEVKDAGIKDYFRK